jgi:hypothetical protein
MSGEFEKSLTNVYLHGDETGRLVSQQLFPSGKAVRTQSKEIPIVNTVDFILLDQKLSDIHGIFLRVRS